MSDAWTYGPIYPRPKQSDLTLWEAKSPTEIVERTWLVPTLDDDSLASITVTATGVTVDSEELDGDLVTLTLSAGVANVTATVAITATTKNGLVLTETFYLPVRADGNRLSYTVRDVCNFALRKVVGVNGTPSAAEADDAAERLTDMLAGWEKEGADLGVKLPCALADVIYAPDWAIDAMKACLTAEIYDFYDVPMTRSVMMAAQRGRQRIKHNLLPAEREGVEYY